MAEAIPAESPASTGETKTVVISRLYDAFERADPMAIAGCFTDDVVWHIAGSGPNAGDHVGPTTILEMLRHTAELSKWSFRVEVDDVLTSEDRAVVLVRAFGESDGIVLNGEKYAAIYYFRAGLICEGSFFWENPDRVDEFFNLLAARREG